MIKYHEKDYGRGIINKFRDYLWGYKQVEESTIDAYCIGVRSFCDFVGIEALEIMSDTYLKNRLNLSLFIFTFYKIIKKNFQIFIFLMLERIKKFHWELLNKSFRIKKIENLV